MSDDELVHIEAAAKAAGLSVPSYLVAAASRTQAAPGMSVAQRRSFAAEVLQVARLLRRSGENLNRLTRIGQGLGTVPPEVPAAAEAMQQYAERFDGVVSELDPRRGDGGGRR